MAAAADAPSLTRLLAGVLAPDARLYGLVVVYGLAISMLTLAVPVSVQVLIEAVANTALAQPVIVLSVVLLCLLLFSGLLVATQIWVVDLFERRFFARFASEIALRLLHAEPRWLQGVNRDDLANRYFEIFTIQKAIPPLLAGGLSLLLQSLVGFVVVSFYHPLFFAFSSAYLFLVWFIWRCFDSRAMRSALAVSAAKYDMAAWLETLARNNAFYRGARRTSLALGESEARSAVYIEAHRRHFRHTFMQTVGFLTLYAVGSAGLLGIGGWLVIQGQLTLGQLVAAELILSAVFGGLARFGYYLELYYEVGAATDKLSKFLLMPIEPRTGDTHIGDVEAWFAFEGVHLEQRGDDYALDFAVPAGCKVLAAAPTSVEMRLVIDLLLRHVEPARGRIVLGGHDVGDYDPQVLRDLVFVIDDTRLPDVSIGGFLLLADPGASRAHLRQVLETAGLGEVLERMERGLDERLMPDGWPLSASETIRLKIAFALLLRPRVLILTPMLDTLPHVFRDRILQEFRRDEQLTVLYFSNRRDVTWFDRYLFVASEEQYFVPGIESLDAHERVWRSRRGVLVPAPQG